MPGAATRVPWPDAAVLAAAACVQAALVTAAQWHRLELLEPRSFDLAIFAQGLWSTAHGHAWSSIQEAPFAGVHLSPLLLLLAPLARLAGPGTACALVAVQAVALALVAPLVHALALPAGRGVALGAALVALLQPALVGLGLDDFHDVTLGVPLALTLALALERAWSLRRLVPLALATALLADEVYPLVLVGAAGWSLAARRRREAAVLLGLGVATFVLSNVLVLGALRGGALRVESLYDHWRDPARAWAFVTAPALRAQLSVLVLALLGPLALLPLVRPARLLPGAVVLAAHAASLRAEQRSIERHYHAPVEPFVLAAFAAGLVALERRWPGRGGRAGLAAALLATLVATALPGLPGVARCLAALGSAPTAATLAKRRLLDRVPPGASVLGSVDLLHELAARPALFGLPGAIRGTKDWSPVPYELPSDLDAVLADTLDDGTWAPPLDDRAGPLARARAARWEAIALDRGLLLEACADATVLLTRAGARPLVEEARAAPGEALGPDPRAPRLVAVARERAAVGQGLSFTWERPAVLEDGAVAPFCLEVRRDGDARSSVRPLLYRLYRARPWPGERALVEHASVSFDAPAASRVAITLLRFDGERWVAAGPPVVRVLP